MNMEGDTYKMLAQSPVFDGAHGDGYTGLPALYIWLKTRPAA